MLLSVLPSTGWAQETDDDVITMEAFNVSVYGGEIKIIDGFTGKEYQGNNDLVFEFARSFNKLLLGFHKKLVIDEVKHMQMRVQLGDAFERQMNVLSKAYQMKEFELDRTTWLRREKSIVTRLMKEPFFRIDALVVWDIDRLNAMAPAAPRNKYAADIHYNEELEKWERRITSKWNVVFRRNPNRANSVFTTHKEQGLNLDTLAGFHYIDFGLPLIVPPHAFREVRLTYPIFYSDKDQSEEALTYLREKFVANLYFIYDPFSWVARRDTRFRGGFIEDCTEHIQKHKMPISDRKWFDPVFARLLSDVVTIRLQGAEEIYSLQMLSKRLWESPRWLGVELDLLNWNKGEKREAQNKPESLYQLGYQDARGMRYVLIDAYQRFGDNLLKEIRAEMLAANADKRKINGQQMLREVIAKLSGMTYEEFGQRAVQVQEEQLALHKITG